MRRPIAGSVAALTISVVGLVATGISAAASEQAEGQVNVIPFAGQNFQAAIEIVDTGSALLVEGEASGLDPTKTYVSLDYTTPPTGPSACEPGGTLSFAQMFLGTWSVDSEGKGSLIAVKTAAGNTNQPPASLLDFLNHIGVPSGGTAYAPLTPSIQSVSVRVMTPVPGGLQVPFLIGCGALIVETAA